MSQGVAQNPLVHISMVLLAQTFGLSGWMTRSIWLHKHVMVLCHVAENVAKQPTTLHAHLEPSFAHGKFKY
jgi:hypothetical protein